MDQRSVYEFLAIKGISAQAIGSELVAVIGPDAIAHSTVTKSPRQRQPRAFPCQGSEQPSAAIIEDSILDALDSQPFSSIRELGKLTCIPATAIHRHLAR
jgi:hypothetical protein